MNTVNNSSRIHTHQYLLFSFITIIMSRCVHVLFLVQPSLLAGDTAYSTQKLQLRQRVSMLLLKDSFRTSCGNRFYAELITANL
jgi:hypothetical protein